MFRRAAIIEQQGGKHGLIVSVDLRPRLCGPIPRNTSEGGKQVGVEGTECNGLLNFFAGQMPFVTTYIETHLLRISLQLNYLCALCSWWNVFYDAGSSV